MELEASATYFKGAVLVILCYRRKSVNKLPLLTHKGLMKKTKSSKPAPWHNRDPGFHTMRIGTSKVGFFANIWKGGPGPTLLVNGATHGDEYEGPTLLAEIAASWKPRKWKGTLVSIPVLNEPAFYAGTRNHPEDGKNLARTFPGDAKGTATQRLAHLFMDRVLRHADYYVDFHSGGVAYDLHPWVGYMTASNPETNTVQKRMAGCFHEFWCWESPYNSGRTISAAGELDIPAIYIECRGGGGVDPHDLEAIRSGWKALLHLFKFIPGKKPKLLNAATRVTTDPDEAHLQVHYPSPCNGLFAAAIPAGEKVRKNQILGTVYPLDRKPPRKIAARESGTLVNIRRKRSVLRGEALATLSKL